MKKIMALGLACVLACLGLGTALAEYGSADPGWTPQMGASPEFLATLSMQDAPGRGYQKADFAVPEYGMEQAGAVEVQAVEAMVRSAMPVVLQAWTQLNPSLRRFLYVSGHGVPGAAIIVVVPAYPSFTGSATVDEHGEWGYAVGQEDDQPVELKGSTVTVTQIEPGKGESGPVYKVVK